MGFGDGIKWEGKVWNYDPISRGLKLQDAYSVYLYSPSVFGTMTRFLGD